MLPKPWKSYTDQYCHQRNFIVKQSAASNFSDEFGSYEEFAKISPIAMASFSIGDWNMDLWFSIKKSVMTVAYNHSTFWSFFPFWLINTYLPTLGSGNISIQLQLCQYCRLINMLWMCGLLYLIHLTHARHTQNLSYVKTLFTQKYVVFNAHIEFYRIKRPLSGLESSIISLAAR